MKKHHISAGAIVIKDDRYQDDSRGKNGDNSTEANCLYSGSQVQQ